jgi:hypothetical protein
MSWLPFSIFLAIPLMVFDATRRDVWRRDRLMHACPVAALTASTAIDWSRLSAGGIGMVFELLALPLAVVVGAVVVLANQLAEMEGRNYWRGQASGRSAREIGAEIGGFLGIVAINWAAWMATDSRLDPVLLDGQTAVAGWMLSQISWALGETAFYSAYLTLTLRAKLRGQSFGMTLAVVGGALIFTFQHVAGYWTPLRYLAIFPAGLFLAVIFLRRGFWVTTAVHWLLTLATTGAAAWTAH